MMIYGKEALGKLGFLDGINEVIATTKKDGVTNAAPLGIIKEGDYQYIRLFTGTHTYDNILANGWFVANITHDSWLFAETALEDLTQNYFVCRDGQPTLEDAEAWALFKCDPFPLDIVIVKVELVKGEVLRRDFRAINRGANLVVEAAVAATRYLALRTDSYYEEIVKLRRIVDRCGGPREREAMDRLMDRIENYSHI
jgi:hypothetical protein